jgi:hypothetical protein
MGDIAGLSFRGIENAAPAAFAKVRNWLTRGGEYAPPGADTEFGRLLWAYPPPLIDPNAKTVVIFSPKSACSSVVVWFFHHLGHAKAARDFHFWPHHYREQVYYHSLLYQKAYDLDFSSFKVIRVVRDPNVRAVSAFRHLLSLAGAPFGRRIGMSYVAKSGLTFSEFLDYLESLDLTRCETHFALQRHPIEDRLPVHYLINVSKDDLFDRLNEVERDLGLERTDLRSFEWIADLARRHQPTNELKDVTDVYSRRFYTKDANKGPWPRADALLTPAARERLARLYAVDIKAYGMNS